MAQMSNLPDINIHGKTNVSQKDAATIARSIASLVNNYEYAKDSRFEDACSRLMDLYLEGNQSKFKSVLKELRSRVSPASWSELEKKYLGPSMEALDKIQNLGAAAEKMDVSISASSIANLEKLGMSFQKAENGGFVMRFAPDVKGDLHGNQIDFGEQKLTIGPNIVAFAMTEANGKFLVTFHNSDGKATFLEVTSPKMEEKERQPVIRPNYTPGTRYAVVSKLEIEHYA